METPQYKVIQDSFMEPNPVKAGSIIRTWGPPGPHLEPLNQSAIDRMEEWYNEEHDEIDPKTGKLTGQKFKPHAKYRVRTNYSTPGDAHHIEVVSGPTKDQPGSLSLAETLANPRISTDQRPPPQEHYKMPSTAPANLGPVTPSAGMQAEAAPAAPPMEEAPPPSISEATPPSTDEPPQPDIVFSAPPPSAKRIAP